MCWSRPFSGPGFFTLEAVSLSRRGSLQDIQSFVAKKQDLDLALKSEGELSDCKGHLRAVLSPSQPAVCWLVRVSARPWHSASGKDSGVTLPGSLRYNLGYNLLATYRHFSVQLSEAQR